MRKVSEKLDIAFRYVILGLFGLFILYLTLLSLFSTNYCFVGAPGYFVSDSPVKALLSYVLLVCVLCVLKKYHIRDKVEKYQKWIRAAGNVCLFLFLLYFVISTQLWPHGDQLAVCNAAVGLENYDFFLFSRGNYFDYWPFQGRIVVFLWFFFKIFGNLNYLAVQILNIFCIVITLNLLTETFCIGEENVALKNMVFLSTCLFLPFLLYVSFIYGNIIGLTFIMAALHALVKYLRTHSVKYLALTVLCCAVGVWLKNTYLIFMVAILVFLLMDFWQRWSCVSAAGMVCVLLAVSLIGKCSDALLERRMGFPLGTGSPMIAWVTMAFGEEDDGDPVKYDAYNVDVYIDNDMDTEKAKTAAWRELELRLRTLTDTPSHFIRFMGKKIALAWNEPTFESIVANTRTYPQVEEPDFVKELLREDNRNWFIKYANLFHALVLMGALSWVLLRGRKEALSRLLFAVIFIGGFLFELFWETYAQYTLAYFLLLIPYAVLGYLEMASEAEKALQKRKIEKSRAVGIGAAAFLLLIVRFSGIWLIHDLFRLDYDDVLYTEELQNIIAEEQAKAGVLQDGHYIVSPLSMDGYGIAALGVREKEEGKNQETIVKLEEIGDLYTGVLELHHEYDYDMLRIGSTQLLLSLSGNPAEEEVRVGQDFNNVIWKIIEIPEVGYAIMGEGNYALTADGDMLSMQPFTGSKEQIWNFNRK